MSHEPTFKLSPQKRPLYQRLTPVAWLVIIVAVAAVAFLGVGLFKKLQGDKDTPLVLPETAADTNSPAAATQPTQPPTQPVVQPTQPVIQPTQEPAPALQATDTSAPMPTTAPIVEPTDTSAPPTPPPTPSPAPTATTEELAFAPEGAWWVDQMVCNEQDECTPPDEVADAIIASYWEWVETIPHYISELDMTPEQLALYYTGELLELQLEFVSLVNETGAMWDGQTTVQEYEYELRLPHVTSCLPDGLTCFLGETVQGSLMIYEYDLASLQVVNSFPNDDPQYQGVMIWRYEYDLEDGRWKVEKYYEWIPASTE